METSTLAFLVRELQQKLGHSLLEKVQQSGPAQLVFRFARGRLLISADDRHPTLYLVPRTRQPAAGAASPFTLLAQKYLAGGRLDELQQVAGDRIVRFRFTSWDASHHPCQASLVAELIDRRANLYLLDGEEQIIAQLIRRRHQRQLRGERYVPPAPVGRYDMLALTEAQLEQLVKAAASLDRALVQNLRGFSPLMAREVAWRARTTTAHAALQSVVGQLTSARPHPHLYAPVPLDQIHPGRIDWQKELILSPISLSWPTKQAGFVATEFASISEALETYEQLVHSIRTFQAQQRGLSTALRRQSKKLKKRRARLEEEMEQLGEYEQYRRLGELLLAQTHQAERGVEGYIVTDYYDPEQRSIEVPAAAHLTPQQAARVYFDRYGKCKRKLTAVQQQLAAVEQQMARLDELAAELASATTSADLSRVAGRLMGGAPAGAEPSTAKQKTTQRLPGITRFHSSDQHEILVGRSAEANQRLTFKIARPHDIWLHAADYPGSHVVLRKAKREPIPFRSLVEAAQLAAFFSQARRQGKVVVNYTERKYVHKIRGAAAGLVRLADFKSITVAPRVDATRADV